MKILGLISLEKAEGIFTANCVETNMQKDILSLLPLRRKLLSNNKKEENGKGNIEKKVPLQMLKGVETGTNEIWNVLGYFHERLLNGIYLPKMVEKSAMNGLKIGIKIILKKEDVMIEQCMQLKQENLLDLLTVLSVKKSVNPMLIMRTTRNILRSFGFVPNVIFIYIISTNITVRDLTKKLRKEMRKSQLPTKAEEAGSKRPARHVNFHVVSKSQVTESKRIKWQAGGKAKFIYLPPGYNNDPYVAKSQWYVDLKPSLIDLEAYGESYGDRAQAA